MYLLAVIHIREDPLHGVVCGAVVNVAPSFAVDYLRLGLWQSWPAWWNIEQTKKKREKLTKKILNLTEKNKKCKNEKCKTGGEGKFFKVDNGFLSLARVPTLFQTFYKTFACPKNKTTDRCFPSISCDFLDYLDLLCCILKLKAAVQWNRVLKDERKR